MISWLIFVYNNIFVDDTDDICKHLQQGEKKIGTS
jgi:hypothetical protein